MKARAGVAAAALALASALILCACSDASVAAPPPPTESQIVSLMSAWPAYEAAVVGSGSEALTRVTFVRFVPDADWYQTVGRCTEARNADGALADGICLVQYPPESVRDRLKTRRQLDYIYGYYAGELVPCMQAHGFVPTALPDRVAFIAMSRNGLTLWNPYSTIGVHDPGFEAAALSAPSLAGGSSSGLAALAGSVLSPRLVALLSQCPALPAGV